MASVDARKLKDSAAGYLKRSKFEKAAEVLEQLVLAEPKDMQHRFRLGDCYRKLAQPQKSIAQYDAAGRYYADQGQLIKAIAAVKVILEIDPRNAEAQKQLAEMNERRLGKVTLESAGLAGGKRAAIGRIAAAKAVPDGGAGQAEAIELPEEPQITKRVAPAPTRGAQRGAMADRMQIDAGADDADVLELDDSPKNFSPGYSQDALITPPPEAHSGSPAGHLEIQDLPDAAILEADPEDLAASPDDEEVVALSLEPGRPIADLLGSDAEEEIELLSISSDRAGEPERRSARRASPGGASSSSWKARSASGRSCRTARSCSSPLSRRERSSARWRSSPALRAPPTSRRRTTPSCSKCPTRCSAIWPGTIRRW